MMNQTPTPINNADIVHAFKVNFTHFTGNNFLDLDPNSTIVILKDRTVRIIPENYQSSRTTAIQTPKKQLTQPNPGIRTVYHGDIQNTREEQGIVKEFNAYMAFFAGGELYVDFNTKVVRVHVSGSGVPTIENVTGTIV